MYKLIVMDYKMPNCDGGQATVMIRNYLKECHVSKLPYIVCLSNFSTQNQAIKNAVESAGMDEFVSKPIFR